MPGVAPIRQLVIDAYSALSHKGALGEAPTSTGNLAPSWVPDDQRRRINAILVRAAYLGNVARHVLGGDLTLEEKRKYREYGDALLMRDRVVGAVLGESWEIVVDGADAELPDEPDLPPEPQDPGTDANEMASRVFVLRQRMWTERANKVVDEWERAWADQPALQQRQEWLREWADGEMFAAKLVEAEGDTVGLGDGVHVLTWSESKGKVVHDIYDPGHYFPVLTDNTRGFPDKVHIAWEFEDDEKHRLVRRLTWEMAPIDMVLVADGVTLAAGDRLMTTEGRTEVVRDYPWRVNDDGQVVPYNRTCYFSDGTWEFAALGARGPSDFADDKAVWAVTDNGDVARRLDLRLDDIPVIHVPNTPADREHFGTSILDVVAQILDDLAATDSDVQKAQGLAAMPLVHLAGADPDTEYVMGEGQVWGTAKDSTMTVLDLSAGLPAVRESRDDLLKRLSVNARIPEEVLGRVNSADAVAGIAMALAFSPFTQLIGTLRMTREPKYRLLLTMVQRLAMVQDPRAAPMDGQIEPGPTLRARVAFGSYLPSDANALVEQITKLLAGGAMSTQTAVTLLVAGGWQIEDAKGEVARIHAEQASKAKDIADATGSEQLAADFLGVDLPAAAAVAAPTITLPPPPGAAGA